MAMDMQEAIEYAQETLDIIDEDVDADALDRGQEFFESVRDRLLAMLETMEKSDFDAPTAKQEQALRNMRSAVEKWVR